MEKPIEFEVGQLLEKQTLTVCTAESCTGGLIAHKLTNSPGSSVYFKRGYIAYCNDAKIDLLLVNKKTIDSFGAVSQEVATEMAVGAKKKAGTDLAISVTGIAGPGGETEAKPVGLVYIALASPEGHSCKEFQFSGSRIQIKEETSIAALNFVKSYLLSDKSQ